MEANSNIFQIAITEQIRLIAIMVTPNTRVLNDINKLLGHKKDNTQ